VYSARVYSKGIGCTNEGVGCTNKGVGCTNEGVGCREYSALASASRSPSADTHPAPRVGVLTVLFIVY